MEIQNSKLEIINLFSAALLISGCCCVQQSVKPKASSVKNRWESKHVTCKDIKPTSDAYRDGYQRCLINETVEGEVIPILSIASVFENKYIPYEDPNRFYSCWTRDLYWGFLGWAQAGDDSVLQVMKDCIRSLIIAKNKNQANGKYNPPINDQRYYIPQAFCKGFQIANDFMPQNAESQAHFILLARDYWNLTGDTEFIKSIWKDLKYVAETIEKMDTNGNLIPDYIGGSYDYQGVGINAEEPHLTATVIATYHAMNDLAKIMDEKTLGNRYVKLAEKLKIQMNKPVSKDGLWMPDKKQYVNMRTINKDGKNPRIDDRFIPYENLTPIFYGVTSKQQEKDIFDTLNKNFKKFYDLKYGPMYVAGAVKTEKSEFDFSSVPWLGFVDVFIRLRDLPDYNAKWDKTNFNNASKIFKLLIDHAYDVPPAAFTEGMGPYGYLTGCAGRSWDNGNFFHTLIVGICGLEKSQFGIKITAPKQLKSSPVNELENMCWRNAVYNFEWKGKGEKIKNVTVDGIIISPEADGNYLLKDSKGNHEVIISL